MKRILFAFAALLTVIALFYAAENWRGTRDYQKVMDGLRGEGEELDFAKLIPISVPDSENFGSAPFLQSLEQKGEPGSRQAMIDALYLSIREVEEAETPEEFLSTAAALRTEAGSTEEPLAFLVRKLEQWQPIREELLARLPLPYARWNRTFESDRQADTYPVFNIGVFPLMKLISLQARVHWLQDDSSAALEDVLIGLRIGEMYGQEPGWIFHVLFLADLALLGEPIKQGLRCRDWDVEQLDRLNTGLAAIDLHKILLSTMRGERAFALTFKDSATRSWRLGSGMSDGLPAWMRAAPKGWALRGFGALAKAYQQCINGLKSQETVLGAQVTSWKEIWADLSKSPRTAWTATEHSAKLSGLGDSILEAARQMAIYRAVIQINKFKLSNGRFPATLDELRSVPNDPLDGHALVYDSTADGFQIETRNEPEGFPLRFKSH